jgi:hypothetical protein
MPNYDFIHLPPWRARARRAGVRSNPGNDHQRARSQMPDRPPFQSQRESAPPEPLLLAQAKPTPRICRPLKSHR